MIQRFRRNKKLFQFYYLFMIPVIGGIWLLYINNAFRADLAYLIMLTAYLLLFSLAFLVISRYHIQTFLFLLMIISGVYGFHYHAWQDYSVANSLYSTLRLFVIDIDNVFTKEGDNFAVYPLEVEIARWSAALYLISTVFQIAYLFFYRTMKLFFYKLIGRHYVISGYQEQSKILIEDLCEKGEHVILLTEGEGLSSTEKEFLVELGVVVLVGTRTEHDLYDKAGLNRAACCILFDEDDSSNLDELIAIKEYFLHRPRLGKPL